MTDITWGPEIAVDGKRPEWLRDGEQFQAGGGGFEWFGIVSTGKPYIWNADPIREPSWNGVDHIRLPADHPHYASTTPQAPDLTARMEALEAFVSFVADTQPYDNAQDMIVAKARALLSEPVDPLQDALTTLDVFLATYPDADDDDPVGDHPGDDLLRFGHLRHVLRALEKGETA